MIDSKVAIIGSGFGGLAAAIRLRAAGFETTLFEAREQPGGRAHVHRQQGFVFDGGPTVITVPECIEELFQLCGRELKDYVELLPVSPMYRILWRDGQRFDYVNDEQQLLEQIERMSPDDVEGYKAFIEYSRKLFETGYVKLADKPFLHFPDMLKQLPALTRLRADRTLYGAVSRYIRDEHLRQAFTLQSLLVGGNPFETSAIYAMIHFLERRWGVFFPRGGTGALVTALVQLYTELGGEMRLSCPVERITMDGRQHMLTLPDGESEVFDLVVSNADVQHTYRHLYRETSRARPMRWLVERGDWSMSLFLLYFGVDKVYDDICQHTIILARRYRELLKEIFHGSELPEDFSLYLHCPTVTDPSLAPEGCSTFYALSPVPHLGNADIDWEHVAENYADTILASLEEYMPDLRSHVVCKRIITPRDFQSDLRAYQGSAFSLAPKLTQSAWFRPHNRDPLIPGLYLVGAGTHPGAGIPGVISSAKGTAELIIQEHGR